MSYFAITEKHPELLNNENTPFQIVLNDDEIVAWQKKRNAQLEEQSRPPEWAEIGIVFNDPFIVILRDLVEFPDGYRGGYIRLYNRAYIEGGAAGVAILPEKDGKFLLMYRFRHATRSWHWEIPRGFGEPGINADVQAKNEIEEEVEGKLLKDPIDLGVYFNNTGLEGNPVSLFLTHLESIGEPEVEEGIQTLRWFSISELEKMIADAEITDGFTIAAYTRAKLKGLI
jgi:ADP-ribose pyrophosphatase